MDASSPLPPAVSVEDFAFQSPQPLSPHSNVVSSPPAPPLTEHIYAVPVVPPQDYDHDHSFLSKLHDESSDSATDQENGYTSEEGGTARLDYPPAATSSRSSISSLPVSVAASAIPSLHDKIVTPTKARPGHLRTESGLRLLVRRGVETEGDRDMTPFRNPSSVRAMQMRDDYDDEDEITAKIYRRGSHISVGRQSAFSTRSSNSTTTSPTKRGSGGRSRSNHSSPQKSLSALKLKKEFPLVLLHCSLLPPALPLQLRIAGHHPDLLKEVLPEEYWKRWKVLEDKVTRNAEVRARGVLIPHPKVDYDLLEERLLESLELERPKLRSGHFLGNQQEDVDVEEEESEAESTQGSKCPDCGRKVALEVEMEKKWEVKVYAANGLMRAGAWSAAWAEMEKVDVEVGVWMPEGVRREIDARLHDMGLKDEDIEDVHGEEKEHEEVEETDEERRRREIYGNPGRNTQENIDGLFDEDLQAPQSDDHQQQHHPTHQQPPARDLQTLAINYLKYLAKDFRNVALVFLSVLVLFYAMAQPTTKATIPAVSGNFTPEVVTTTITATSTSNTIAEYPSSASQVDGSSMTSDPAVTETATEQEPQPIMAQVIAAFLEDDVPPVVAD